MEWKEALAECNVMSFKVYLKVNAGYATLSLEYNAVDTTTSSSLSPISSKVYAVDASLHYAIFIVTCRNRYASLHYPFISPKTLLWICIKGYTN